MGINNMGDEMYYLGIAFNGDRIEFLLIDDKGNIHGYQEERHMDIIYDGQNSFRGTLESGIARVCLKASIRFDNIGYTYLAIPEYGENQVYDQLLTTVLDQIFKINNYICENDAEAAFIASLAGSFGVTVLAGAGSAAIGVNYKNQMIKSGGWGKIAGDEGGEYWFARKILEIFAKEADGRYDSTILYHMFKEKLSIENDYEIINFTFENLDQYNITFEAFLSILFESAEAGDTFALQAIDDGAYEYYLMINGILKQLFFKDTVNISYIGTLFEREIFMTSILQWLDAKGVDYNFYHPKLRLITGAALKALMFRKNVTYQEIYQLVMEQDRLLLLQ